jgi:hypothetical protein
MYHISHLPREDFSSGDGLVGGELGIALQDLLHKIVGEGEPAYAGTMMRYLGKNVAQIRMQTFSRTFL